MGDEPKKDKILEALGEQKTLIETKIGEVGVKVESLEKQVGNTDTRLKEVELFMAKRKGAPDVPGLEVEKEKFSFLRAINAIRTGNWKDAGFEKEVFEATKKDMSQGTDTAGGFIVPNVYIPELIELLRAQSTVMQAGATVLDNLQGSPIEIPKQTGGATAYWVGENAEITASDLTVGQVTMTPKAVGAIVKLSNRLLKLSNPSAEAMIRRDLAQVIALAIDLGALRGSGASDQPTGVANTGSINTYALGVNGGTFRLSDVPGMEYELDVDNALRGALGFITHPKIVNTLKTERIANFSGQTAGSYVMLPMSDQNLRDQMGYSMMKTTQLPVNLTKGSSSDCTEVYFANWQELLIGQWGGLEILASNETSDAFAKNQTWVRVIQEVDIAVRHPESFCLCNDARTG